MPVYRIYPCGLVVHWCIRLCSIVACLRALCQLCVKRTVQCICVTEACAVSLATCTDSLARRLVEEVRTKRDRSAVCRWWWAACVSPRRARHDRNVCLCLVPACQPARSLASGEFVW